MPWSVYPKAWSKHSKPWSKHSNACFFRKPFRRAVSDRKSRTGVPPRHRLATHRGDSRAGVSREGTHGLGRVMAIFSHTSPMNKAPLPPYATAKTTVRTPPFSTQADKNRPWKKKSVHIFVFLRFVRNKRYFS